MRLLFSMSVPAKGRKRMEAMSRALVANWFRLACNGVAGDAAWRVACNHLRNEMLRYQRVKGELSSSARRQSRRNWMKAQHNALALIKKQVTNDE